MKKFKKTFIILTLFFATSTLITCDAQDLMRWIQQPSISPNGKWIAFSYQGNLWKVSSKGGQAIQLTDEGYYSGYPIWSKDGSKIGYAADQYGNFDIFVIDADGKNKKRLTFDSRREIPSEFSADNLLIYFTSNRHDVPESVRYPADNQFLKLYSTPVNGGRSRLVNAVGVARAKINAQGTKIIYQDAKGVENPLRKHQIGSATPDVMLLDFKSGLSSRLSTFAGLDMDPIWGENDSFYYLSERDGTLNVFENKISDTTKLRQLTFFDDYPVRDLSRSNNGRICFINNGDIFTLIPGASPKKLNIFSKIDKRCADSTMKLPVNGKITELTVSRDGKQLAFVSRGDIFVCSIDGKSIVQLTATPYAERFLNFSPCGKSILYSAEHRDSWDVEEVTITGSAKNFFYENPTVVVRPVISSEKDEFQGTYSPDGSKIAYIENRDILKCIWRSSGQTKTLIPKGINYSSEDGDQFFSWSPDSRYLLAETSEGSVGHEKEITLIDVNGIISNRNITNSGFKDNWPQWSGSGDLIYWVSDRLGFRNFTLASSSDVFAYRINPNSIDKTVGNGIKTRLTLSSSNILSCKLSADQKKLYYLSDEETGTELWMIDLPSKRPQLIKKLDIRNPRMEISENSKYAYLLAGGIVQRINLDNGHLTVLNIELLGKFDLIAERVYILKHIYRLIMTRFADPKTVPSRIDLDYKNYSQFVPNIRNDYDFSTLLNEFLGELNTSHTGISYSPVFVKADQTAALGLLYDEAHYGDGLFVKKILSGGPFDNTHSRMALNAVITAINGIAVRGDRDWSEALNQRIGIPTDITFCDLLTGSTFTESIIPVSQEVESRLLYNQWVHDMEFLTDSLSKGRIGYVHIPTMNEEGFRILYDKALGKFRNAEALVVDTRYNRGGSLHDEVTTFLNGKVYLTEHRQGQLTKEGEPYRKWTKNSAMIVNEANYSDAFLTPYTYKLMGLGKLVGTTVPGTGTGSIYETLINERLHLRLANALTYFVGNSRSNESIQLEPDIEIHNEYPNLRKGIDQQLECTILELLQTIH